MHRFVLNVRSNINDSGHITFYNKIQLSFAFLCLHYIEVRNVWNILWRGA
jgi:hypothetical protein